jgi:hypothetical protein
VILGAVAQGSAAGAEGTVLGGGHQRFRNRIGLRDAVGGGAPSGGPSDPGDGLVS